MLLDIGFYIIKYTLVVIFAPLYILRGVLLIYLMRNKSAKEIDFTAEPSCLQNSSLGKHGSIYLKKRNIEIHHVAKGDRTNPLMVFVHGFPEFWYTWRFQLREFGKDYYAVALDMPGYSGSSKPKDAKRYDGKELAADIKEFILELGFESCILVGHDWGAILGYEVAYYFPEVVKQLIVINGPYAAMVYKGLSLNQIIRSSYIYYFQIPIIPEYFFTRNNCQALQFLRMKRTGCKNKATLTEEDVNAYRYTFMKSGWTGPLNYYRQMMQPTSFFSGRGRENIKVPTLIIWGTDDKALGVELAAFSARFIEKCSVKYIDDASHWVPFERPDEVNKNIRKYLTNIE